MQTYPMFYYGVIYYEQTAKRECFINLFKTNI